MGDLLRGQFGLTSEFYSSVFRRLHACAGAFGDQAALQFGQDANHLLHGAAGGGLGVDMLGQGAKRDALVAQRGQHGHEIAQTPASAVTVI